MNEYPVAIVGGGPSGLFAALLLGRLGVKCLVIDRRNAPLDHPRAMGVTRRTGEIYRSLGIFDTMMEPHRSRPDMGDLAVWCRGLTGEVLGRTPLPPPEPMLSPCEGFSCPQPHTEKTLREAALATGQVEIKFSMLLTAISDNPAAGSVELTGRDVDDRYEWRFHAKFVLGADGARSSVRHMLGIETDGPGDLGHYLNSYFEAPITERIGRAPAILTQSIVDENFGVFVAVDGRRRWLMHRFLEPGETVQDYPVERITALIAATAGLPDLPIDVISMDPWVMSPKISTEFRRGRIFLVGDAATRLSPAGGLGLNNGLQGVHNLIWKVAMVYHGQAGWGLLDTYQTERMKIATDVLSRSVGNSGEATAIVKAAMEERWEEARALAGNSVRAGSRLGLELGYHYHSKAMVPEEEPWPELNDPVNDFIPSARSGGRMPHVWLDDAKEHSILDEFHDDFVLVSGGDGDEGWRGQVEALQPKFSKGVGLRMLSLGNEPRHLSTYGIESKGAVLVRPDGMVAWRCRSGDEELAPVLKKILIQ